MVKILLLGGLRERCGAGEIELAPCPANVAALKEALKKSYPFLDRHWPFIRVAVNLEFQPDTWVLRDSDEVALIPPVAGGANHPRVLLLDTPLSLDHAISQVMTPAMGGLCLFAGVVRNHARGQKVVGMEYHAYGEMALRTMERILLAAETAHCATVACHHRVGTLGVGEIAVVIAAASAHREAAFAAARQVIEELKKDVPIWKKEWGEDGHHWVGLGP